MTARWFCFATFLAFRGELKHARQRVMPLNVSTTPGLIRYASASARCLRPCTDVRGRLQCSDMPGRRWSVTELQVLRQQVAMGHSFREIVVAHRSPLAVRYQLWRLSIYPTHRWTPREIDQLRQQARRGHPPWNITLGARSHLAIRQKMIRLGLWQPRARMSSDWTTRELRRLAHLVRDCGYTARQAVSNGYFPGRTVDAIAQQMRRQGLRRTGSDRRTR